MKMNGYSTHQPLLVGALVNTTGPILEIGGGYYSTPLISSFANCHHRQSITLETSEGFYHYLKQFETEWHEVRHLAGIPFDPFGKFSPEPGMSKQHYIALQNEALETLPSFFSVVFVDQGPGFLRAPTIKFFSDKAEFIVMHDSNNTDRHKLAFLDDFKFRWDYRLHFLYTTVVSNVKDCSIFSYLNPLGDVAGCDN